MCIVPDHAQSYQLLVKVGFVYTRVRTYLGFYAIDDCIRQTERINVYSLYHRGICSNRGVQRRSEYT